MDRLTKWLFNSQNSEEVKVKFYLIYSSLSIPTLIAYSVIGFSIENYIVAIMDLILAGIVILTGYYAIKSKSTKFYSTIGLLALYSVMTYNFATGGFWNEPLYWTYTFPLTAMFVSSLTQGLAIVVLYIATVSSTFILSRFGIMPNIYSNVEFFNYITSFTAVTILAILFKNAWEFSHKLEVSQKESVENANVKLESNLNEVQELKNELEQSNKELKTSIEQTEKVNKAMVDRELAMVKLKERIQELEQKS